MKSNRCAGIIVAIAIVSVPAAAKATFICNGTLGFTYPTGPSLAVPSGDAASTTYTVNLALGAGTVDGVTNPQLTINRLRFDLDCTSTSSLPCADQGPVVEYEGDGTISSDCPAAWASNVPAGGSGTNEIVFTPTPALTVPAGTPVACTLSFKVRVLAQEPTSPAPGADSTPFGIEEWAGYIAAQNDATCNNGLSSGNEVSGTISVRPPCTTGKDASLVQRSAGSAVACNYKRLLRGPATTCRVVAPPACAGSLVSDAVALAYGANNPPAAAVDHVALKTQLACQRAIGTAVARFVGGKLRRLVHGISSVEAEAKARAALDRLPKRCTLTVQQGASGVIVPDVGKQVDAAVGAPGTAVDPSSLAGALVTLLETWVDRVGPHPAPLRPNIVFILTDDQRFDTVGLTHSIDGVTPVMPTVQHELVEKGVAFQNSYVTTDLCAPSRSSLLAAKYSHTTGVHDNGGSDGGFAAFNDSSTIAVWLKAAGYHTGIYGKYINGYGPASPYQAPGWDEWHVFKDVAYFDYTLVENGVENAFGSADADYSTDVLRDKAVQFIHDAAGGPPFFLYFAPKAPHAPATPAPRHAGMFSAIPPWRPANYNEADVSDKPAWVQAIAPWGATKQANTDAFDQHQLETLQAVDEAVAALIQALRDIGQDANTMIVFASDNGYSWGSHRWQPKQCPYEECMRVPLVVRYAPLAPLPRSETGVGLNIDHGETLAELAGATADPGVEGASLVRLLDGTTPSWRTDFLEEHWDATPGDETDVGSIPTYAEVRGPQWKYNEYVTDEKELYDESADPFELLNAVTDPGNASVVSSMATRLRELRPDWPPP